LSSLLSFPFLYLDSSSLSSFSLFETTLLFTISIVDHQVPWGKIRGRQTVTTTCTNEHDCDASPSNFLGETRAVWVKESQEVDKKHCGCKDRLKSVSFTRRLIWLDLQKIWENIYMFEYTWIFGKCECDVGFISRLPSLDLGRQKRERERERKRERVTSFYSPISLSLSLHSLRYSFVFSMKILLAWKVADKRISLSLSLREILLLF
jgi:hypothetical protein